MRRTQNETADGTYIDQRPGTRTGQTRVQDTEEISQRRRLKELLTRRREVLDTRDRVMEALEYRKIGYERAVRMYAEKLTTMIIDIYPMFQWATDSEGEAVGRRYLYDIELDRVTIHPPEELRASVAVDADPVEPKTVVIEGLDWFSANGIHVAATFDGFRGDSAEKRRVTTERVIPFRAVDQGVRAVEVFLHEVDVDVQWDEGAEEAEDDWREKYLDRIDLDEDEVEELAS